MANRTTLYSPELAEDICERLADGASLNSISKLEGMPTEATIRRWAIADRDGFAAKYAQAREVGYLKMADELVDIADDNSRDVTVDADGKESVDYEVVARSRLRVDTRKWMLARMLPKVYGDKTQVELAGKDGGPLGFVLMGSPEPASAAEWLSKHAPPTGE